MRILPLLLLLAVAACRPAATVPATGSRIEVTGILIDTHCHAADSGNVGRDHDLPRGHVVNCAGACARLGYPVGVLTGADHGVPETVWVLVTVPQLLEDYMAETVRVTGEVRSDGVLIPERIELRQDSEWTFIL